MNERIVTEDDVRREIVRLERLRLERPELAPMCDYRLSYCRRLLAALRDGNPDAWIEYPPE